MIVVCFGLQRSGSTLAFELARAVLERAGHDQARLSSELLGHDRPENFVDDVSLARLERIERATGERTVAIKTHAAAPPDVAARLAEQPARFPAVLVSYRDPRGIGLSLLDAGHRARLGLRRQPPRPMLALDRLTSRNAYGEAFASLVDHGDAIRVIEGGIARAATWLACPQAHPCGYDALMSDWDAGAEAIAKALGGELTGAEAGAALEGRFTQLAVGRPGRWREVLSPEMDRLYRERLGRPFERVFGHAF
ncbi:MAG TPA: hypothetical protein VKB65_13275 [Myxococcota bacterium]|nr:hypothetical protein [Myxococcota bacterium]